MLLEALLSIGIFAAPLIEWRSLAAAARLLIAAANKVMDKDEFELRRAAFQRVFEPLILI